MKKCFTLIELLVVIAIIGLLTGLVVAKIGNFEKEAKDASNAFNATTVERQLETFKAKYGRYPGGFHTGYVNLTTTTVTGANIEPNFPMALRANYVNNTTMTGLKGNYTSYRDQTTTSTENAIGSHTSGAGGCGISLQRAGITAVNVGNTAILEVNAPDSVRLVRMNDPSVRLMHANDIFTACDKDGVPLLDEAYELKIKGRSLREWYGRSYGSFEKITCVIPLYITEGFTWRAYDEAGNLIRQDYKIAAGTTPHGDDSTTARGYMCFFICDMLPQLDGRDSKDPRPAELLGVVSMDEFQRAAATAATQQ